MTTAATPNPRPFFNSSNSAAWWQSTETAILELELAHAANPGSWETPDLANLSKLGKMQESLPVHSFSIVPIAFE